MRSSPSRRFPVTVTQLPVTRYQICHRTVAYRPGNLSEILTEHYRRAHPEALGLPSQAASVGTPQTPSPASIARDDLARAGRDNALLPVGLRARCWRPGYRSGSHLGCIGTTFR